MSKEDNQELKEKGQEGSELDTGVKEEGSEAPQDQEPDWKAIAEAETKRADNYKTALYQKRQLRNKPTEEIVEEDDDKPLTRKDIREILQDEVVPVIASNKEDQILTSKVTDPNKREAVRAILNSSIKRTGTSEQDILNDIDKAVAIADSHKLRIVNAELKRKIDNKLKDTSDAGSSNEREIEANKLAPELKAELERKADALKIPRDKFIANYLQNRKRTSVLG